jgi:hypothetical protein
MKPRLPVLNSTKNKLLSTVAVTVLAVGSLVYVGVQLERSTYQKPLPANILCLSVAKETPNYYQAKMLEIFGEEPNPEVVSKDELDSMLKDCEKNVDNYHITLKGK